MLERSKLAATSVGSLQAGRDPFDTVQNAPLRSCEESVVRPLVSPVRIAVSIGVVLIVTVVCHLLIPVNPTTAALAYVATILLVASGWGVRRSHRARRWLRPSA